MQRIKPALQTFCLLGLASLIGCSSGHSLMPTPNLYAHLDDYPAEEVPESLRTNRVELLYVTDRTRQAGRNGEILYGSGRSTSVAYGSIVVEIGNSVPWKKLVEASQTDKRKHDLSLSIRTVREHARFPETPHPFFVVDGTIVEDEETRVAFEQTAAKFRRDLVARLDSLQTKEVIVFVHGFNNTFQSSAFVLAELWHFTGRRGVPVLYSWPAASGGLFGYFIDRESGEFTIFHLKAFLRLLADTPDVHRIHIIAHSRGADVTTTSGCGRGGLRGNGMGLSCVEVRGLEPHSTPRESISRRYGRVGGMDDRPARRCGAVSSPFRLHRNRLHDLGNVSAIWAGSTGCQIPCYRSSGFASRCPATIPSSRSKNTDRCLRPWAHGED